jgi:hypothetical protein
MNQDSILNNQSHNCPHDLSVFEARRSSSSTPVPRTYGGVTGGGLMSKIKPPLYPFKFLVSFLTHNFSMKGIKMKQCITLLAFLLVSATAFAQDDMEVYHENPDQTVVDDKGDVKPISVTPSVNLLNFPHPLEGAVEVIFSQAFSIKYSKSFEPSFKVDGSEADIDNHSFGIRAYPDQGAFFFGLAYGKHEVSANRYENINGFDTNIYAHAEAEYVTPSVGWKWVYDSGFTIGLEFGWLFPFNGSAEVSSNQDLNPLVAGDDEYEQNRRDVEDAARKYVDKGLPSIGLLEIGWTF